MNLRLTLFLLLATPILSNAQQYNPTEAVQPQGETIVFRFVAEDDTFYIPYQENGEKLNELVATVEPYKSAITNRQAKINVDSTVPTSDKYYFALRTNLLYDAMLVPNLGIEWRASESFGIKVDAGGSRWGSETGNVQKIWYMNPEVRYYMGGAKRIYVGIGGNYGEYNIYKGMLGSLISKDMGYQGTMWNAGAVVGYQLPLGRSLALDFNLGLGYSQFKYDKFTVTNEVRVSTEKDQTKNLWGPTQAGVSLVWRLGGK